MKSLFQSQMPEAETAQANQNLQVGFVHLPENLEMDPGWAAHSDASLVKSKPHPDSIRIWGRHFAPIGNVNGPQVSWSGSDFFTLALMDPARFSWAKSFLESSGCSMLMEEGASETCFTFCIPKKCPSQKPLECSNAQEENNSHTPKKQGFIPGEQTDLHLKRKFSKAPLVCTKVRRSNRLKSMNQGFKSSTCPPKNSLCCDTEPPTLSSRTIRSLGKEFCKIPSAKLTDDNLKKKQKKTSGPGVKQGVKATKAKEDDDKPTKKKSKKN